MNHRNTATGSERLTAQQKAMSRQTISYLTKRFQEVGIRPDTRKGQNFLVDLNLIELLARSAELSKDDVVLEVGTGTGSLTAHLARSAAWVVTAEIEEHLHQLAREELLDCDNITFLREDALKNKNTLNPVVLEAVRTARQHGTNFKLAANLPYNVATPIISNLLALEDYPSLMSVTIQKELADRIMARPSTKDYSALSIWIQSQCETELVRVMTPGVFWPRPKVHSAILKIRPLASMREKIADVPFFHTFVRSLFFHRRKYLRSVLLSAYKGQWTKPDVDAVLDKTGLSGEYRAEQLDVATIIGLCDAVREKLAELNG